MNELKHQLFEYKYNNEEVTKGHIFGKKAAKGVRDVSYLPIVYHTSYDISFYGLQRLHPFDCQKWSKTFDLIHSKLKVCNRFNCLFNLFNGLYLGKT